MRNGCYEEEEKMGFSQLWTIWGYGFGANPVYTTNKIRPKPKREKVQNDQQLPRPQANNQPPYRQQPLDYGQQQAANIIRGQVDNAYQQQQQSQNSHTNPYLRTHQQTFDWNKYHTAWQEYYQQYYQRYYGQQIHLEKQRLANNPSVNELPTAIFNQQTSVKELKKDILATVKEQADKTRRNRYFAPILGALLVAIAFLLLQFNSIIFAQMRSFVSPGTINGDSINIDPSSPINVGPNPKLIIPKINVEVPVDYTTNSLDEAKIQLSLRDGATYYPLPGADALPGQKGNTSILGHSSNDIFHEGKYKFVFVLLDKLEVGDVFYLHYQGVRYIYKVTEKRVISPKDIAALQRGTDKPIATLITCTPPGTDFQRLLIFGDQISPSADTSKKPTSSETPKPSSTLPGNEPTLLDQIWRSLFGS
jgi:sortase A